MMTRHSFIYLQDITHTQNVMNKYDDDDDDDEVII